MSWSTKQIRSAGVRAVEHDEERLPDRIGQDRLILRRRLGSLGELFDGGRVIDRLRGTPSAAPKGIQADPRYDGRQPAREVADIACIGGRKAEPGLLQGVVGILDVAEDPKRHGTKMRPIGLELVLQRSRLIHGVTIS